MIELMRRKTAGAEFSLLGAGLFLMLIGTLRAQDQPTPAELLRKDPAIDAAVPGPLRGVPQPAIRAGSPASAPPGGAKAGPSRAADDGAPRKGTLITATKEAFFDNKERKATFTGDVVVIDPQFTLSCDGLTVFLKKEGAAADPKPPSENNAGATGSLERAIAVGNVVVTQKKQDGEGKVTEYIGKGEKGVFNAKTGDFELTGWPEVRQGINRHVATEESTVMTMTRDGRMKTSGGSRTMIQETPSDEQ